MVGITPSRSGPVIGVAGRRGRLGDGLQRRQRRGRAPTSSRPSGVNTTCRPAARSRMRASSCRSSARMPAERVDCVTAQAEPRARNAGSRPARRDSGAAAGWGGSSSI